MGVFNVLLTNHPQALSNPAVYLNRALALRGLGQYDEAAKDYALYLELITDTPPTPAAEQLPPVYTEFST